MYIVAASMRMMSTRHCVMHHAITTSAEKRIRNPFQAAQTYMYADNNYYPICRIHFHNDKNFDRQTLFIYTI